MSCWTNPAAIKTEGDDKDRAERADGCHLLFCLAIGGPSAAKVASGRHSPCEDPAGAVDDEVLERTRVMFPVCRRRGCARFLAGAGGQKPKF